MGWEDEDEDEDGGKSPEDEEVCSIRVSIVSEREVAAVV